LLEIRMPKFDANAYLPNAGFGRSFVKVPGKQSFFSQGEAADSIFFIRSGRAKLTVASKNGLEATITLLAAGEFVGEESLASQGALHLATATSITDCTALRIEREEMLRLMNEEQSLSEIFITFLITRGMRIQSDLVDQLFNSIEKRLARILLVMAKFGEPDQFDGLIPEVTEDSLARMIGASEPSVSIFLNRFRALGLIDYDGCIRVNKALLNAVLHDQLPGDNAVKPSIIDGPR
jgi:CRP/FNR family transcriptional regulator, cyclic AMP receptor protein